MPVPDSYDALLIVAFGGPEGPEDVIPFLENVLRGRNVPRERMLEVADHYQQLGGKSPINDQVRELKVSLEAELAEAGITLPVYWGNRNWHPLLVDTLQEMHRDGVRRVLAVVLSSFSSYSGCRQYRENIAAAQAPIGEEAPCVDKVRVWYNHPDFIEANADCLRAALEEIPSVEREAARVLFTAHSIPKSMADHCAYEKQLLESCRLVSEAVGIPAEQWQLVYQSRSGRPQDPWLEPDVNDALRSLAEEGQRAAIVMPIGFLSDHVEVQYDLDDEAMETARSLGMTMVRAATVGCHPQFVSMLRKLIEERMGMRAERDAVGQYPANHDVCPANCCLSPQRPATSA